MTVFIDKCVEIIERSGFFHDTRLTPDFLAAHSDEDGVLGDFLSEFPGAPNTDLRTRFSIEHSASRRHRSLEIDVVNANFNRGISSDLYTRGKMSNGKPLHNYIDDAKNPKRQIPSLTFKLTLYEQKSESFIIKAPHIVFRDYQPDNRHIFLDAMRQSIEGALNGKASAYYDFLKEQDFIRRARMAMGPRAATLYSASGGPIRTSETDGNVVRPAFAQWGRTP
jgi:hypothetical protein